MDAAHTHVEVEDRGHARWMHLRGRGLGNAVGPHTIDLLHAALDDLDHRHRSVVLTGDEVAFCAGADVAAAADRFARGPAEVVAFMDAATDLLARLRTLPVPTVAAVDGVVRAGGLELLLACDLAVATDRADVADGHAIHGFVPAWGATAHLPTRVPRATAARLLLTDASLSGDDLLASGLVSELVPAGRLVPRVDAITEAIAARGRDTVTAILDLLRARGDRSTVAAEACERSAFRRHLASPDLAAGLARFTGS